MGRGQKGTGGWWEEEIGTSEGMFEEFPPWPMKGSAYPWELDPTKDFKLPRKDLYSASPQIVKMKGSCGVGAQCTPMHVHTAEKAASCALAVLEFILDNYALVSSSPDEWPDAFGWISNEQSVCWGPSLVQSDFPALSFNVAFLVAKNGSGSTLFACVENTMVAVQPGPYPGAPDPVECIKLYKSLCKSCTQLGWQSGPPAHPEYVQWLRENGTCKSGIVALGDVTDMARICSQEKDLHPVDDVCGDIKCSDVVVDSANAAAYCATGILGFFLEMSKTAQYIEAKLEEFIEDWDAPVDCSSIWLAPIFETPLAPSNSPLLFDFDVGPGSYQYVIVISFRYNSKVYYCPEYGSFGDGENPTEPGYKSSWISKTIALPVAHHDDVAPEVADSAIKKFVQLCSLAQQLPWGIGPMGATGVTEEDWLTEPLNLLYLGFTAIGGGCFEPG